MHFTHHRTTMKYRLQGLHCVAGVGNFTQLSFLPLNCQIRQINLEPKGRGEKVSSLSSPCSCPVLSVLFSFPALHSSICAMRVTWICPWTSSSMSVPQHPIWASTKALLPHSQEHRQGDRGLFVSQSCVHGFLKTPSFNWGAVIFRNWKDKELKHSKMQRKERCSIFHPQRHKILIKASSKRNLVKNLLPKVKFLQFRCGFHTAPNKNNSKLYLVTTENYICAFKLKRGAFRYLPLAFLPMKQAHFETIFLE